MILFYHNRYFKFCEITRTNVRWGIEGGLDMKRYCSLCQRKVIVHFADKKKGHRPSDQRHDLCRQCWESIKEGEKVKQYVAVSEKRDRNIKEIEERLKELARRASNHEAEYAWQKEEEEEKRKRVG